ncbi:hypothetical protein ALI22I_20395 [Saccharothrix sp. ALI-22-I]|uniref:hypothetical protein n=1 Tax=Saccharothrix sp. ALI-22-I TaxID=1933778 RepID=UPI00097C0422|nr:hypothetical protein [Saccharothrix sp. ALI-22-I]ONI88101.1 hypothetical protein ALI22I_20395 [Saccharothrix sp. ALI-22-I]
MNLKTATPGEIDSELAKLYGVVATAYGTVDDAVDVLHHLLGDRKQGRGKRAYWLDGPDRTIERAHERLAAGTLAPYADSVREHLALIEEKRAEVRVALDAIKPLEGEHERRGWTRYFIVTSSNGHIHANTACSNRGWTAYGWLPKLSDLTPADAVEAHGPLLCTKCFPNAPVEWTVGKAKPASCAGSGKAPVKYERRGRFYGGECAGCGTWKPANTNGGLRKH